MLFRYLLARYFSHSHLAIAPWSLTCRLDNCHLLKEVTLNVPSEGVTELIVNELAVVTLKVL